MNNQLLCWAKTCEHQSSLICGPFIRLSLHPPLITVSLFLVVSSLFHCSALISSSFYISSPRLFIFSPSFHRLSGDMSAMHDRHGNNVGKARWRTRIWFGLLMEENFKRENLKRFSKKINYQ